MSSSSLRLIRDCYPPDVWFIPHENGTEWMGQGSLFFREFRRPNFAPIVELVTEFNESNDTLNTIQTIFDGDADLDPDYYGMDLARFRYVDFSYPIDYTGIYIISRKNEMSAGEVIGGIFDTASYFLFTITNICLAVLLWLFIRSDSRQTFWKVVFYCASSLTSQALPNIFLSQNATGRIAGNFISTVGFFVGTMYGSIVMSKLTAKVELGAVNSLSELAKMKDVTVHLAEHSFAAEVVEASISGGGVVANLKIGYYDMNSDNLRYAGLFLKVHSGYNFMVESKKVFLLKYNSMPAEVKCRAPLNQFGFSREPLTTAKLAWLYKKGLEVAEEIDLRLMRLDAAGLLNRLRGEGLFTSKKMDSKCPEGMGVEADYSGETCQSSSPSEVFPLSVKHLGQAFKILGVGLGASMVAFMGEMGYFKFFSSRLCHRRNLRTRHRLLARRRWQLVVVLNKESNKSETKCSNNP